jgi:hypothetical protein
MNHMFPEITPELNRKRIRDEMACLRLEEEAIQGQTLFSKNLAMLGDWMVAQGEILRKHHSSKSLGSSELIKKAA